MRNQDVAAVWCRTDDLLPWADNPRVKDDAHIEQTMASIKAAAQAVADARGDEREPEGKLLEDGFGAPIVARLENSEIIAGHTRLHAAQRLGMPRVPVRFMDLPEDAAHRLARADNKLTETGTWDVDKLIRQLKAEDDVLVQGWTPAEVERMSRGLSSEDAVLAELRSSDTASAAELKRRATVIVTCDASDIDELERSLSKVQEQLEHRLQWYVK